MPRLLDDVASTKDQRVALMRVISGVVGYANNMISADTGVLAASSLLRQRFAGRDDLTTLLHHVFFGEFIDQRAVELVARKQASSIPSRKKRRR